MFCDDGATCTSYHEVYDRNCGGNILLDSGSRLRPDVAQFDHLTNVGALEVGCKGPGAACGSTGSATRRDTYSFINAIFWGNAPGLDFAASCDRACDKVRVTVSHSMVQTDYVKNGPTVTFGPGITRPTTRCSLRPKRATSVSRPAVRRGAREIPAAAIWALSAQALRRRRR